MPSREPLSPAGSFRPNQPLVTADALVEQSREVEREERADEAASQPAYADLLPTYVQEKTAQVDRIEQRLEGLLVLQQDALQDHQAHQPGFLARPSTRQAWAAQDLQLRSRLEGLQARLEFVHELRDGMGARAPRVEELATRKLRFEQPEIAAEYDDLREAARRHHLLGQRSASRDRDDEARSRGLGLVQSLARRPD